MAVIVLQSPIAELRGTVGAVTYSRNAAARYAKGWRMIRNMRSPDQQKSRNYFGNSTLAWREEDDTTRNEWAALAAAPPEPDYDRFGNLIYLSGLQWYTRVRMRQAFAGQAQYVVAPTVPRPDAYTGAVMTLEKGPGVAGGQVIPSGASVPTAGRAICWMAITRGVSRIAQIGDYRYYAAQETVGPGGIPFYPGLSVLFPLLAVGWTAWCRLVIQDFHGLRSVVYTTTCQITAPV